MRNDNIIGGNMSLPITINQAQKLALARAAALTREQIKLALDLSNSEFQGDPRALSPEILSAVIQALAMNYARSSPD